MISHQKGQLERLLLVQTRVTERRIVCRQVVFLQALTAAQTLGDRIARELEVHAAKIAALLLVDAQALLQLLVNVVEATSLDARIGRQGVAVHRVALPDDAAVVLGVLDGADMLGQQVGDLAGAVARNQGDLARLALWVERAQERKQVVDGRRGADLDANGVGNAAEELDVGVVKLACTVADPEEMRRRVVVVLAVDGEVANRGGLVFAGRGRGGTASEAAGSRLAGFGGVEESGQSLFVFEKQAFVAGVDVDALQLFWAGVDDFHEAQGLLDARRNGGILFLEHRVADMAKTPVKRTMKISNAGSKSRSHKVECSSRVVVRPCSC